MRLRSLFFFALFTFLSVNGLANDNIGEFDDQNMHFHVGLSSHEKDAKVSGTNVNCTFSTGGSSALAVEPTCRASLADIEDIPADSSPAQSGTWDSVELIHLKVECDTMIEPFLPPAPPPIVASLSKEIRIASTHFPDGSTISFTVKGKFHLVDYTIGGMGSKDVEFTHIATLKAFNRGMTYEHGDFAGLGSTSGGLAAKIALESMKHTVTWDERNGTWTETMFVNDLALVTALHAGSHGISSGIYDNFSSLIDASDVYGSRTAAAANGVLPVNVGFVDACYVGQSAAWFQNLLHPYSAGIIDRAAVGFTIVVNSNFSPEVGDKFWDTLKSKATIGQARLAAINEYNRLVSGSDEGWTELTIANTPLVGDPKTRLNGVYTGDQTLPATVWYKVL